MRPLNRVPGILMLAVMLAACASPTATVAPAAVATPIRPTAAPPSVAPALPTAQPKAASSGSFFARPEGAAGPLIAYDLADGSMLFSLPAGRLSADGKHYFATLANGAGTWFNTYDLATGATALHASVSGQWQLSAVSATGLWAALSPVVSEATKQQWTAAGKWQSQVQIVDARTGTFAQSVALDGNFEVDGLSNRGDALYLIQYLPPAKPDHYQVRLYDLNSRSLVDGALVDKRAADEVMAGDRWQAVGSPDGQWLLTLYLRTSKGTAFIHALDQENRYTLCLDLPSQPGNLDPLKFYTLALAPNGHTIYAANAALGVVAQVNLNDFSVVPVGKFQASVPAKGPLPQSLSVVAPDGRAVYFTDGAQAWVFDTSKGTVRPLAAQGPITGLGVSADGSRVYVARTGQPLLMLDASAGLS